MNNREVDGILNEVDESISELMRALDRAAARALEVEARDIVERVTIAKSRARRGAECMNEFRRALSRVDQAVPSQERMAPPKPS